jgi:hypothetical protein
MATTQAYSKYTPERVEKIISAIKGGNAPVVAARWAGINKAQFQIWMDTYPEFALMVDEAEAHPEIRSVALIRQAAEKQWTAAAWWLERTHPERWGRVDRVEIYQVQKQAEALVEELRAEGINVTQAEILKEREGLLKHALPAPGGK